MAKLLLTCTGYLREDSYNTESKINFVLYDVILTFKGVEVSCYDVPQFFRCQNLESVGLSEIVLNEHFQIV